MIPIIMNKIEAEIDSKKYPVSAIPTGVDTNNNELKNRKIFLALHLELTFYTVPRNIHYSLQKLSLTKNNKLKIILDSMSYPLQH